MDQDFIRTAHAKGLGPVSVDYRHVAKNALIPIVTVLSFTLAGMLTTGFITERILGIPGVGDFAIQSIFERDYPDYGFHNYFVYSIRVSKFVG